MGAAIIHLDPIIRDDLEPTQRPMRCAVPSLCCGINVTLVFKVYYKQYLALPLQGQTFTGYNLCSETSFI